ncbi:MAG: hypothetical protein LH480_11320 [Rubrivivax sp.]|nr:hypothetical protein [Rubrivivax sp.]
MRDSSFSAMSRAGVALLYPGGPGDRAASSRADPAQVAAHSRFAALFDALAAAGVQAQPAVHHDDVADEVQAQLLAVDVVLVWCNPIEGGRRHDRLDAMLRTVAARWLAPRWPAVLHCGGCANRPLAAGSRRRHWRCCPSSRLPATTATSCWKSAGRDCGMPRCGRSTRVVIGGQPDAGLPDQPAAGTRLADTTEPVCTCGHAATNAPP